MEEGNFIVVIYLNIIDVLFWIYGKIIFLCKLFVAQNNLVDAASIK